MLIIVLIGIANVIWAVANWWIELQPAIYACRCVRTGSFLKSATNSITLPFKLIILLIPFGIDLGVTIFLVGIFNFGGLYGGTLGLFMSNLISLVIIHESRKFSHKTKEEAI